jgi:hypothetical protein
MRSMRKISTLKDIFNEIHSKNTLSINSEAGSLELFGGKYWYDAITRAYASEHYEIDYPCHAIALALNRNQFCTQKKYALINTIKKM